MTFKEHRSYGNVRVDPRGVFYRNRSDQAIPVSVHSPLPVTPPQSGLDAFGRARVSDPHTSFDWQTQYNEAHLWLEDELSGLATSTHLPNESSVLLSVTASAGSRAVRQSREYIRYQPGKSQLIVLNFVFGLPKTNLRRRVGYFDDSNGLFLEQSAGQIYVVRRSNTTGTPVDIVVSQSDWTIDTMDGTGASGITLDFTKTQILVIDMVWLGAGRVRFGFDINGHTYHVHEFFHANVLSNAFMGTANLPIRWEIENTGATDGPSDLLAICGIVMSEGGQQVNGIVHSVSNGTTGIPVSTQRAVLSIRPKLTFGGQTNRGQVINIGFILFATANNIYYEVFYNHNLGGTPVWTSVNDDSIVEYDVAGTTVTGGIRATSGYIPAGAAAGAGHTERDILGKLPLTLNIAGTEARHLSLVCTAIGGPTATCYGALEWLELY